MLDKGDILRGLERIDKKARKDGIVVDLSIYGGAALALAFDIRQATRDVDAVIHCQTDFLRRVVKEIADEENWSADWLNDGVKGFVSSNEDMRVFHHFADCSNGGLRIHIPSPEYLFAMKCMAMRAEGLEGSRDISDIESLANEIGIRDVDAALSLIESFYPSSRIPPKVRFGIEEIMERISVSPENDGKVSRKGIKP
ncbi:MAG: DUF6036 family nucleotidyltransferase [Thiotrichales bacterium]